MLAITPAFIADTAATVKVVIMVVFVLLFVGVVVRIVMTKKSTHDQAAQIPLHDDVVTPRDNVSEGSKQ